MTVALAHQASSPIGRIALREAAREARLRTTDLAVIHIVDTVDLDLVEAHLAGLSSEIGEVHAELRFGLGLVCGRKRIARLMRNAGLRGLYHQRKRRHWKPEVGAAAWVVLDCPQTAEAVADLSF